MKPPTFGVGPDEVGGTADDPDVDFGEDVFNPNESFTGIEDPERAGLRVDQLNQCCSCRLTSL
jgi:hypothetical protein